MLLKRGDRGPNVTLHQKLLKAAGANVGNIDGVFGSITEAAVVQFQVSNSLSVTGTIDNDLSAMLTTLTRTGSVQLPPISVAVSKERLEEIKGGFIQTLEDKAFLGISLLSWTLILSVIGFSYFVVIRPNVGRLGD